MTSPPATTPVVPVTITTPTTIPLLEPEEEVKEDSKKQEEKKLEEKKQFIDKPKVTSFSFVVKPIPEPVKPIVYMNGYEKDQYIMELQMYVLSLLNQIINFLQDR